MEKPLTALCEFRDWMDINTNADPTLYMHFNCVFRSFPEQCFKAGFTLVRCSAIVSCFSHVVLGALPLTSNKPRIFKKTHESPACFIFDVLSENTV